MDKSTTTIKEEHPLKKVRVSVPFVSSVSHVIYVTNPEDLDEISEKLADKDPSTWEVDPCFYEQLGDVWKYAVNKIKKEDVEVLEGLHEGD